MTDTDASYKQAVSLLGALAKIQRLLHDAEQDTDDARAGLMEACKLVEHHTLDVKLRDELMNKCTDSQLSAGYESWKLDALNTYNAALARARESENRVFSGTLYLQRGLYNEAFMIYTQCEQADELVSHVHVLQRNWPFILTRFNHQFTSKNPSFNNEILLNIALANWCSEEYWDCLSVLLRLDLHHLENAKLHGVWLTHKEVKGMLVVCVLLVLDSENLKFFLTSDRLAQHFEVKKFVVKFYDYNVKDFWDCFYNELSLPWLSSQGKPKSYVRDKLLKNWLSIYNKIPLALVLETFGLAESEHAELDLLEDLRRWEAPYKVNFVDNVVFYEELHRDTVKLAERLSWEFKRDSLLLLWKKNLQQ